MIKSFHKVYPIYIFADLIFIGISFYLPYLFTYNSLNNISSGLYNPSNFKEYSFIFAIWAIFILLFFKRRNLFSTDRSLTIRQESLRVLISILYSSVLIGAIIFFAQYKFFSRRVFIENCLMLFMFLSLWRIIKRLILRRLISKGFHNINVLIIGSNLAAQTFLAEVRKRPWLGFKVVGFLDDDKMGSLSNIPILGKSKDLSAVIKRYFVDEVIISDNSKKDILLDLVNGKKNLNAGLRLIPNDFLEPLPVIDVSYMGIIPVLTYKERGHTPYTFLFKRLLDLFSSLLLLILLFPFFVIIGALIKLDAAGPVFYTQNRVGLKGRNFKFYKFRSMINNAEELRLNLSHKNEVKDGVIFKIRNDPRTTRIGKLLRKYSLDELPQLMNVLNGDMSLVGPRPPTPDEVEKYKDEYMQRLSIRPGITGLAQIRGRSDLTFYHWMRWDTWYINNWTLGLDIKILWQTVPAIIKGKGAY